MYDVDWASVYRSIRYEGGWLALLVSIPILIWVLREILQDDPAGLLRDLVELALLPFLLVRDIYRDLNTPRPADPVRPLASLPGNPQPQGGQASGHLAPLPEHPQPQGGQVSGHLAPLPGNPQSQGGQVSGRQDAEAFLRQRLAAGPVPAGKILAEAQALGIPAITLKRAKAALGIRSIRTREGWLWTLP